MNTDQLHEKLKKHLDDQSKNWDSFIYAKQKGFYQGFDEINIDGCRPTEKRFERYNIDQFLSKDKSALDIGSNCGFFSLYVSRYLKSLDGVELNPFLISIGNDSKDYLKITNVTFFCSEFEKFQTKSKYDIVFSLANDSTIDKNTRFNFEEYIQKIQHLLKDKGILIFESQAEDVIIPGKFEPKMQYLKKFFKVLENKMVKSEYPINVPERIFLVLEKI